MSARSARSSFSPRGRPRGSGRVRPRGSRRGLPCAVASRGGAKLRKTRSRAAAGLADRLLLPPQVPGARKRARPGAIAPGRQWTRTRSRPETARGRGPGGGRFRAPPEAIRAGPGRTSRPAPLPARRARAGQGTWVAARPPGPGARRGEGAGALPKAASGWFRFVSFLRLTLAACRSSFSGSRSRLVTWPVCELRTGPHPRVQSVGPRWGRRVFLAGTRASSFVASHASVERLDCLSTWGLTRGPRHTWRVYLLEQGARFGEDHCFSPLPKR